MPAPSPLRPPETQPELEILSPPDVGQHARTTDPKRRLLEALVSGEDPAFVAVQDAYVDRCAYYDVIMANVLAETISAYRVGKERAFFRAQRQTSDQCMDVWPPNYRGITTSKDSVGLRDNVVELSRHGYSELYWVSSCDVRESRRHGLFAKLRGWGVDGHQLQDADPVDNGQLESRLFAGDYAQRYRSAAELWRGNCCGSLELESAVLQPGKSERGTYEDSRDDDSACVPINDSQSKAVNDLHRRLELIHGPPGTGKSTTIFHVLNRRLPPKTAAVVTCVTNQAVDAVAEKLAKTHDMYPMLVLGNPDRIGKTARWYTLERLCDEDWLCPCLKRAVDVLADADKRLRNVQEIRATQLFRWHKKSRLKDHELEPFAKQHEFWQDCSKWESMSDIHVRRINKIKEQMARAAVRGMPVRCWDMTSPGSLVRIRSGEVCEAMGANGHYYDARFRHVLPNNELLVEVLDDTNIMWSINQAYVRPKERTWAIGKFHVGVQNALATAYRLLAQAEETTKNRVVSQTRVFLSTISSSHKIARLKDDHHEDFPERLFVAVVDEAAATPETYTPLLMQLGVENLVLLGDHKQLEPLVLYDGPDWELPASVHRSLMERAKANGAPMHELREQYRMPPVICKLVSKLFYQSRLITAGPVLHLDADDQFSQPRLRWIDVRGPEQGVGKSKANVSEAVYILDLLHRDPVFASRDDRIMVVSLYKQQGKLLQRAMERQMPDLLWPKGNIEVVTVDAAQGTEASHIVLSLVRSNQENDIGFARNPRRLCVALSRAKRTLTIVGNAAQFKEAKSLWRDALIFINGLGEHGLMSFDWERLKSTASWDMINNLAEGLAGLSNR